MKTPLSVAVILIGLLALCTDDYNPFEDATNARMKVMGTVFTNDSAKIFSTRLCTLAAAVSEQIDSVVVEADDNRYFTDTTITEIRSQAIQLLFSFVDTGAKEIIIETYRKNDDHTSLTIPVYVYSPLNQESIDTALGAEMSLHTEQVEDSVWYHWVYGNEIRAQRHSRYPTFNENFSFTGKNMPGKLWVSLDSAGNSKRSPSKSFAVTITDNAGPRIFAASGTIQGDTVFTGDNPFDFEALVRDPGGIHQVHIDGSAAKQSAENYYYARFNDMSRSQNEPQTVTVAATDLDGNSTTETFYVRYDPTIQSTRSTQIMISGIKEDTATVSYRTYLIQGNVREYIYPNVGVYASVNESEPSDTHSVPIENTRGDLALSVVLDAGFNTIAIVALDSLGNTLTRETVQVIYDPTAPDTDDPKLTEVTVNGIRVVENRVNYIVDTTALLSFIAWDESGIESATVNNNALTADNDGFHRRTTLGPVPHSDSMLVAIEVTDNAGMKSAFSFFLRQNHKPRTASGKTWPSRLLAGSSFEMSLDISDEDEVTVELLESPQGMKVEKDDGPNNWSLSWDPDSSDTGSYTVTLTYTDHYQDTAINWNFDVIRDTTVLVQFATSSLDFPALIEVGDEFSQTLTLLTGTGKGPFGYKAQLTTTGETVLDTIVDGRDPVALRWAPRKADIGIRHLMVTVTDAYGDSDALYRDIQVAPANEDPCTLDVMVPDGIDTTGEGALDLRDVDTAVTLRIEISDSDHPLTEHHQVTIETKSQVIVIDTVSDKTVFYTIKPFRNVTTDTIRVIALDATGTRDTMLIPVLYPLVLEPTQIEGLAMWYDAAYNVELVGPQTQRAHVWGDRHTRFVRLVADQQAPLYVENVVNELPALQFDGDNRFINSNVDFLDEWVHESFTIAIVARPGVVSSTGNHALIGPGTSPKFGFGISHGHAGIFKDYDNDPIPPGNYASNLPVAENEWHIFVFRSSGADWTGIAVDVWLNGERGDRELSVSDDIPSGYFVVGSSLKHSAEYEWEGDIAEIIYFDKKITDENAVALQRHLARKFGLSLQ
ncbi:MAG: hypothetical protein GF401_02580 [Chitinivibrionales bacterium]|nr:hypothetical protein [Chitinivibrionales bacterium]